MGGRGTFMPKKIGSLLLMNLDNPRFVHEVLISYGNWVYKDEYFGFNLDYIGIKYDLTPKKRGELDIESAVIIDAGFGFLKTYYFIFFLVLIGRYLYQLTGKKLVGAINSYFCSARISHAPISINKLSETMDDALQAICLYIKFYINTYNEIVGNNLSKTIKALEKDIENKARHKATLLTIKHLKGLKKERKFDFKVSFMRSFKFEGKYYKSLRSFCIKNNLSIDKMYRICKEYIISPEKAAYYLYYNQPVDRTIETPNPTVYNKPMQKREKAFN